MTSSRYTTALALILSCATSHAFVVSPPSRAIFGASTPIQMSAVEDQGTDVEVLPGTADVPWKELGFEFRPTKSHLKMTFKDGKWGAMELDEVRHSFYSLPLSKADTCCFAYTMLCAVAKSCNIFAKSSTLMFVSLACNIIALKRNM